MRIVDAVLHALSLTGSMAWAILWALVFGFLLSSVVQAVVRRDTITSLLGDDRPPTLAVAAGLGMASSSCSYAAVALARGPCSARAQTSPRQWLSRSPRPTW